MKVLELQEIIFTRIATSTGVRYHLEIKGQDAQGNEKVFHYDDLRHPDLYNMRYFIDLNVHRAEIEHAKRIICKVGADDVIIEK